jgi:hypothetical protein
MLKNRCKASLRQHSKAKALNRQRRWPIKAAELSLWVVAGASRQLPFFIRTQTQSVISRVSVAIEVGGRQKGRCVGVIDETGSEILK